MSQKGINFSYIFQALDFVHIETSQTNCALFSGKVFNDKSEYFFRQYLSLLENGEWKLERFDWNKKPNPLLETKDFLGKLTNKAASLLYPINMWAGEQTESGAKIIMNQKIAPKDVEDNVNVSFRPNILSMPSPSWENIWEKIENRVKYDDHFKVQGFSEEELLAAFDKLKNIFPGTWIKKQYKDQANQSGIKIEMGMDYPPETSSFWYPSYHIARSSLGAICVDPGLNYLVELGLSLDRLKSVPGIKLLQNSLTKSSGNQHCICIADDFNSRGLLNEVEPQIANGAYRNDLNISYKNQSIDIELKAFTSNSPDKMLSREIKKKIDSLPKTFDRPLIFHAILIENGVFEKEREKVFYDSIDTIRDELSEGISAVVGGRIFVDSNGGRLKRDCEKICINENSRFKLLESDIKEIFKKNYETASYPIYGIGTFFYFENEKKDKTTHSRVSKRNFTPSFSQNRT